MDDSVGSVGHYSVLRYRYDATRDEARNVAVIVVGSDGMQAALRAAPISSISSRLRDQGILDALLAGLQQQIEKMERPALELLTELHESLQHSLYITEPAPTAVPDLDVTLGALYRAYVAPRSTGRGVITKGKLLDQIVTQLRRTGTQVRRGQYVSSFIFDAIIDHPHGMSVLEVLSFANTSHNWTSAEYDTGHFLYAVNKLSLTSAAAIIEPPGEASHNNARQAFERVTSWLSDENVPVISPKNAPKVLPSLSGVTHGQLKI